MALEEILIEHIKALNENTKALMAYVNASGNGIQTVDVEHTKDSACRFCGVTYKTMQNYLENGIVIPCRRKNGKREYFREADLVALCESKGLYDGEYGAMKNNPRSHYYGQ